ncbi:UNVERIFIED_CONTAM: hypothetical protein PYX00_007971 [Menopon gallinae]|uniref:C2H2-type domain-containing protein n=1 Tax=Menopon gallinae TaxID=328185 RepID=A0AAW2HLA6_9NEOP
MLNEEERESEKGEKLLDRCTEDLKLSTIKYAKRQLKWIQNRFQKRGDGQIPPIYGLDVTDVSCWDEKVRRVAEEIVEDVLEGRKPRHEPLPFIDGRDHDVYTTHKCETCGMYLRGAIQFREHLEGNKHRKMLKKKNKKEQTSTQPSDND